MLYLFPVLRDRPELGLRVGQLLAYDPHDPAGAWSRTERVIVDPGAMLDALMSGDLGGVIPPQLVQAATPRLSSRPVLRLLRSAGPRRA